MSDPPKAQFNIISIILFIIGELLILIPTLVPLIKEERLEQKRFTLEVFLPTLIGMIILNLAFYNIMYNSYDEKSWELLIAIIASISILYSISVAFQSMILLRWRSD